LRSISSKASFFEQSDGGVHGAEVHTRKSPWREMKIQTTDQTSVKMDTI